MNFLFCSFLGKEFNTTIAKTVCEARAYVRGSRVECIKFTKRGMNTCLKVCNKRSEKILHVAPTTVTLRDSFCTKKRLKPASCICSYKIMCEEYIHYVFMNFIPNLNGDVAVLYTEAGHPVQKPFWNIWQKGFWYTVLSYQIRIDSHKTFIIISLSLELCNKDFFLSIH